MAPPPTPEQWVELRPVVSRWYLSEQRTARWIEVQIRQQYELHVTTKMLRDRFRAWNLRFKYNRSKARNVVDASPDSPLDTNTFSLVTYEVDTVSNRANAYHSLARPNCIATFEQECAALSRALNTAPENRHLTRTLKTIQDFFSNMSHRILRQRLRPDDLDCKQAIEMQQIAAKAHQAIASQVYSAHQTFADLNDIGARAASILPKLSIETMHPRVLPVLLRFVIDSTSGGKENEKQQPDFDILKAVKGLLKKVAATKLCGDHPVSLLCNVPEDKARMDQLLHHQMAIAKAELFDKIRGCDPEFVACEEIYCARVLASFDRTEEAERLISDVLKNISIDQHLFVHADACRTLAFTKLKAGEPEQAIIWSNIALHEFRSSGNYKSENALYAHLILSLAYRQVGDLQSCELSLSQALTLWTSDQNLQRNFGAVKLIRDLDQVLHEQEKLEKQANLRTRYSTYFEDVRDEP